MAGALYVGRDEGRIRIMVRLFSFQWMKEHGHFP
jgi:hypothetical protein